MQRNKPFVTWIILAIQLLVFLMMELVGSTQDVNLLVLFGAKYNPFIAAGQYWRLITPMFIHIGFAHILFNSLTLYYLGTMVEQLAGHFKFLVIYLLAGVMGNLFSYQFSDSISAGASTSLFGLFAFFIALANIYPESRGIQQLSDQYRGLILINIVLNLFMSNVDLAGHIGGAVGGFLISYALMSNRNTDNRSQRMAAGIIYFAMAAIIIVLRGYTLRRGF